VDPRRGGEVRSRRPRPHALRAELSSWDREGLGAVLQDLSGEDLVAAGFTTDELAELQAAGDDAVHEDDPVEPLKQAVTREGDLWLLGNHRILCGSSIAAADVDRLMNGEQASLVATDPPYLVDYTGKRGFRKSAVQGKDWSNLYREVDIQDADTFFRGLFEQILRVSDSHAAIYCWHAHRRVGMIQRVWEELGILDHQEIVWIKPCPVINRCMYQFQHEPCVMGWRKGFKPKMNGGFTATTVWTIPEPGEPPVMHTDVSSVWAIDWEGKSRVVGNEHPTQKPLEIFARPMRRHTSRGDLCFEPFSGSGSQLIAAEQIGRRCFAMELQPVFVDVAVRRWQTLTGQAASLLGDGRTWAEVAKARGVKVPKEAPCRTDRPAPASIQAAPGSAPKARTANATPTKAAASRPRGGPRKAPRTRGATARSGEGSERSS
jgi:DNA modification methylase